MVKEKVIPLEFRGYGI